MISVEYVLVTAIDAQGGYIDVRRAGFCAMGGICFRFGGIFFLWLPGTPPCMTIFPLVLTMRYAIKDLTRIRQISGLSDVNVSNDFMLYIASLAVEICLRRLC